MKSPEYQARRATLEDIESLRELWRAEKLPEAALEKRVPEFQVVLNGAGEILGTLGLRIEGTQGLVYGESIGNFGLSDAVRPYLWERVLAVARSRGVARLWMLGGASFWREKGFEAAGELLAKLPPNFVGGEGAWFTLKLREDVLAGLTKEQEYALFRKGAMEESEESLRQARVLRFIAWGFAAALGVLLAVAGYYLVRFMKVTRKPREPALPIPLPPVRR